MRLLSKRISESCLLRQGGGSTYTVLWLARALVVHLACADINAPDGVCFMHLHMVSVMHAFVCTWPVRPWMRFHGIAMLIELAPPTEEQSQMPSLRPLYDAGVLTEFARWVPDESKHLVWLGELFGVTTLAELVAKLDYSGPAELLSMWLCLFCSKGMVPLEVLQHFRDTPAALECARGPQLLQNTARSVCLLSCTHTHTANATFVHMCCLFACCPRRAYVAEYNVAPHPMKLLQILRARMGL